jgi:hypothetical protein
MIAPARAGEGREGKVRAAGPQQRRGKSIGQEGAIDRGGDQRPGAMGLGPGQAGVDARQRAFIAEVIGQHRQVKGQKPGGIAIGRDRHRPGPLGKPVQHMGDQRAVLQGDKGLVAPAQPFAHAPRQHQPGQPGRDRVGGHGDQLVTTGGWVSSETRIAP